MVCALNSAVVARMISMRSIMSGERVSSEKPGAGQAPQHLQCGRVTMAQDFLAVDDDARGGILTPLHVGAGFTCTTGLVSSA
jgi:hypothetical protein